MAKARVSRGYLSEDAGEEGTQRGEAGGEDAEAGFGGGPDAGGAEGPWGGGS